MTDNLENKLRMYYSVSAVCECNNELWQDNEVFKSDYQRFNSKIPKIEKCRDQIKISHILNETFKSFDRVELEEMTYYLSGKLKLFAKDSGNHSLYAHISCNRDNIWTVDHYELISICNSLADSILTHLNQLNSYEVTLENVACLQQLTSSFFVNLNKVKHSHLRNETTEKELRKLFKDTDDILRNRLDNDIEFYKNTFPLFYQQYKAARIIFLNGHEEVIEKKIVVNELE